MRPSDPNREQLSRVARALGHLRDELVFVGGATAGLLITDPAAPAVRPTKDVDLIIEVASYVDYQLKIAPALRNKGFRECTDPGAPICAWMVDGICVDVMPTEGGVLGFTNRWYTGAVANAEQLDLEGMTIKVISSPYFFATKFVAFQGRGENDYYASHDLEDIVALVDGRPEMGNETARAPGDVRAYIAKSAASLLASSDFLNALPGHVEAGRDEIILERLRFLATL